MSHDDVGRRKYEFSLGLLKTLLLIFLLFSYCI